MLQIHQFLCLSDKYGFLLHDPDSGETVAIDTPDGDRYLEEADAKGWAITQIWNTHWHPDHAGGNETVAKATGAKLVALTASFRRKGYDLALAVLPEAESSYRMKRTDYTNQCEYNMSNC